MPLDVGVPVFPQVRLVVPKTPFAVRAAPVPFADPVFGLLVASLRPTTEHAIGDVLAVAEGSHRTPRPEVAGPTLDDWIERVDQDVLLD